MRHNLILKLLTIFLVTFMIRLTGAGHLVNKFAHGPVIKSGPPGSWDSKDITSPKVLFHDGTYHMWYTGINTKGQMAIGYATSPDGINWTKFAGNPVLTTGEEGEWDVALVGGAEVVFHNGKYHMWYNGARSMPADDGLLVDIGYATSRDGVHWTKLEENPCIRGVYASGMRQVSVYAPSVIWDEGGFKMWYTTLVKNGLSINMASSGDGSSWQMNSANPAVQASDWRFDFVGEPQVIREKSGYKMYFTSSVNDNTELAYVTSGDGLAWVKPDTEEVITPGVVSGSKESRIGNGSVAHQNGIYKFWYSARIEGHWQICYAEDFENVPHVDKVDCLKKFHSIIENPEDRTLHLVATIHNSENRNSQVTASVKRLDGSEVGSFALENVDGEMWQGSWPMPVVEQTYQMAVTANCNETGSQNCSELWKPARFTTVGPIDMPEIKAEWIDRTEETFMVKIKARNRAAEGKAEKVTARLISFDTERVMSVQNIQKFGEIGPQQTVESSSVTYIHTDPKFQDSKDHFSVKVIFAYDGFDMMEFNVTLTPTPLVVAVENLTDRNPTHFELTQNYPNPFNPATTIQFSLPSAQDVVLNIYNNLGERVATLVNEPLNYGSYSYLWHAGNLPSGIYYYQLLAGPYGQVRKMILVK